LCRFRPQLLLDGSPWAGSSIGRPKVLFTSAEDCSPAVDAGTGVRCPPGHFDSFGTDKSYTVLEEIDLA